MARLPPAFPPRFDFSMEVSVSLSPAPRPMNSHHVWARYGKCLVVPCCWGLACHGYCVKGIRSMLPSKFEAAGNRVVWPSVVDVKFGGMLPNQGTAVSLTLSYIALMTIRNYCTTFSDSCCHRTIEHPQLQGSPSGGGWLEIPAVSKVEKGEHRRNA